MSPLIPWARHAVALQRGPAAGLQPPRTVEVRVDGVDELYADSVIVLGVMDNATADTCARSRITTVRRTTFSERLQGLRAAPGPMVRYMRQQCTSAELIAKLVEMAKEIMGDACRGGTFEPPLDWREPAFYCAVADHGTARSLRATRSWPGPPGNWAPRSSASSSPTGSPANPSARLRSAIKRLLARHNYLPGRRHGDERC